jgi:hypothetical protein
MEYNQFLNDIEDLFVDKDNCLRFINNIKNIYSNKGHKKIFFISLEYIVNKYTIYNFLVSIFSNSNVFIYMSDEKKFIESIDHIVNNEVVLIVTRKTAIGAALSFIKDKIIEIQKTESKKYSTFIKPYSPNNKIIPENADLYRKYLMKSTYMYRLAKEIKLFSNYNFGSPNDTPYFEENNLCDITYIKNSYSFKNINIQITKNIMRGVLPWEYQKLLWIGKLKNNSNLNLLPKEIIIEIIKNINLSLDEIIN